MSHTGLDSPIGGLFGSFGSTTGFALVIPMDDVNSLDVGPNTECDKGQGPRESPVNPEFPRHVPRLLALVVGREVEETHPEHGLIDGFECQFWKRRQRRTMNGLSA